MIEDPWKPLIADPRFSAPAPFARRTWIHPNAPRDDFDRVCEIIWSRTHLTGKGESSAQRPLDPDSILSDSELSNGAEEQQREAADSGVNTPDEEKNKSSDADFTHPCRYHFGHRSPRADENQKEKDGLLPETKTKEESRADEGQKRMKYLALRNQHEKDKRQHQTEFNLPSVSGCRCLHVAKPAQVKCVKENLKSGRKSAKKLWATQASAEHTKNPKDPVSPFPAKLHQRSCQREHEQDTKSLFDTDCSNDDESVPLLGVNACPSEGGEAASKIDMKDREKEEIPHFSECNREQGILFNTETDFPQLPNNKAGITLCPTESSTSRKVHSQWEIPFSFQPHHAPTATLASGTSAPVQAPIQGQELHANPTTDTSPAQQRGYDLLADFPALHPPENPLALGDLCHGNPMTATPEAERGPTLSPNHRQGSAVSHKRRVENVPREVSSICSGDQKSALGLETFGLVSQSNSPRASCEKIRARKQLPPTVAGTDGGGVNARSWASAAKAGMRQAAVPQEKARPCTFQHTVAISGAKESTQAVVEEVQPKVHFKTCT